jgi:eukaryotic-like serine/threonine-protein kinase
VASPSKEPSPSPGPEGVPFGRYLIRKRIAKGGMGEVLLADQVGPLGPVRPVALKRMLPRLARDPRAARMFLDEMAIAAQLNHPNIATTYDFGDVDGMYFIAMEYVEGLSLHDLIAEFGPLPVAAALSIVAQIADALSFAHTRKGLGGELSPVVHRDISPHNIMISTSGAVKLLDFGIARAEQALVGRLEGKLNYAAPEQLQGDAPDRRSDLWALGVVLYEALTGVRPFDRDNPVEMLTAALSQDYVPLEARRPEAAPVSKVVARALLKDATRRWPTAEGFRAACLEALESFGGASAQTLAALVSDAGGPRLSVLGVEAFTSLNLGASGSLGVTQDPADGPRLAPTSSPTSSPNAKRIRSTPSSAPLSTGSGLDAAAKAAALAPKAPRIVLAALAGVTATIIILALMRPADDIVVIAEPAPQEEMRPETKPEPKAPDPASLQRDEALARAFANRPEAAPSASPAPPAKEIAGSSTKKASAKKKPAEAKRKAPAKTAEDERDSAEPARPDAVPSVGLLSVRAVPWAAIVLDGKFVGNSPLANIPIAEGKHTLTLTAKQGDFPPRSTDIKVKAGTPTRVVLDFEANKLTLDQP